MSEQIKNVTCPRRRLTSLVCKKLIAHIEISSRTARSVTPQTTYTILPASTGYIDMEREPQIDGS